jgi:glucose dehydrogenase
MRIQVMIFMIGLAVSGCQFVSPGRSLSPFATATSEFLAPSKKIILNTLPLTERWRWSGKVDRLYIPLLVDTVRKDRIIIIGREGADQRVIVFDAHTGDSIWESEDIGNIRSVTADEKRVYIGTITYVQAFDLETGQKLWRGAEQPSTKRGGLIVHSTGGQVEVYDTFEPMVYILDAATGQMVDEIPKSLFLRWDGIDYAVVHGNYLLEARDAKSDKKLWSYAFPGWIGSGPTFAEDIMLLTAKGQIFGLKARTGEVIWQTPETQTTFTHPQYITGVALQDDLAYALGYDAAIVGFDPKTGE